MVLFTHQNATVQNASGDAHLLTKVKAALQNLFGSFLNLVEIAAYFLCALTWAGFVPGSPFDLFCHFRVQYLFLLVLAMVPIVARKKWIAAVVVSMAIGVNCLEIAPLYSKFPMVGTNSQTLNIVDINFNSRNSNFDLLKALLKENEADIVCWQEFSPAAELWAKYNLADYPYSKQIPRHDNFGIAMFSKLPVTKFEDKLLSDVNIETLIARVQVKGSPLQIICTHTYPPITASALNTRDLQLENLGTFVKESGIPTILCGDLNATSWSGSFKKLLKSSALVDSRQGFGVQPSWPSGLGPLMIPIDHVLVDPKIHVVSRKIGPDVRSDHFPVILKLAF